MEFPGKDYYATQRPSRIGYSYDIPKMALDLEEISEIPDYVAEALNKGESVRGILRVVIALRRPGSRLRDNVIRLSVLRIAQFILDNGEPLADLIDYLTVAEFSVLRAEIVAMYLGEDMFTMYCIPNNQLAINVGSILVVAFNVSYERLMRVIGFYLKYGYSCINLLYSVLDPRVYWTTQRQSKSSKVEFLIANIIVNECGQPFEDLMREAKNNRYNAIVDYLDKYADAGV